MATANKLCFKKALDHKNSNCRKNYSIAESISSSESKLVREKFGTYEKQRNVRSEICDIRCKHSDQQKPLKLCTGHKSKHKTL